MLSSFLQQKHQWLSVIVHQQRLGSQKNHIDSVVSVPHYSLYRRDRQTGKGGGACIYVSLFFIRFLMVWTDLLCLRYCG